MESTAIVVGDDMGARAPLAIQGYFHNLRVAPRLCVLQSGKPIMRNRVLVLTDQCGPLSRRCFPYLRLPNVCCTGVRATILALFPFHSIHLHEVRKYSCFNQSVVIPSSLSGVVFHLHSKHQAGRLRPFYMSQRSSHCVSQ
jgi:hypothetical protein